MNKFFKATAVATFALAASTTVTAAEQWNSVAMAAETPANGQVRVAAWSNDKEDAEQQSMKGCEHYADSDQRCQHVLTWKGTACKRFIFGQYRLRFCPDDKKWVERKRK